MLWALQANLFLDMSDSASTLSYIILSSVQLTTVVPDVTGPRVPEVPEPGGEARGLQAQQEEGRVGGRPLAVGGASAQPGVQSLRSGQHPRAPVTSEDPE
jgi:hypothetical protein